MILNTDGGARGNPGAAAAGIVLKNDLGEVVKQTGTFLGRCTNNEAEYKALILGLKEALNAQTKNLVCFLDSEFVVNQLKGTYRVKNERMAILHTQALQLSKLFEKIEFKYVPRAQNKLADKIVNEVLDRV